MATSASASPPTVPQTPASAEGISRGRLIAVDAIVSVTTLLLVAGCFSVWANRLLFSPDNWSATSTQLLANPQIRTATANYIVDQLYAKVNVPALIRNALPAQFKGLAAPAAGALRNAAVQGTELALQRPRVQSLWATANRAADKTFIAVVNGGKGAVKTNNGVVTLDLGLIVDNVASRLGLPSNLSSKLPPNIATLTILKSDQLKFVQDVGRAIQHLALWLTILVPVLYALAIALARDHRRRTLMTVGFAGVLGGVLVILLRSIVENQVVPAVTSDASLRPAVRATIAINTQILGQIGAAVIAGGVVLVLAAWFAGPARAATSMRRAITPFLRSNPAGSYAAALGIMVLIFIWDPIHATGTPAGIIVFTALAMAAVYVLRRQVDAEFPDAQAGDAGAALRASIGKLRRGPRRDGAAATSTTPPSTTPELIQLADLRDRHAITPEEYEAAKAKLLHDNGVTTTRG